MNLTSVKKAMAVLARGLTGVERSDHFVPDVIYPPHFYIGETTIDWTGNNNTFGGDDDITLLCRLLVGQSGDESSQDLLSRYMRRTGSRSVKAVLEGVLPKQTLGGLCDDLVVHRMQGHRMYQVGDNRYYGAEWVVQILGDQDEDDEE